MFIAQRILIMGLPGSGKTFLAEQIKQTLQNNNKTVTWLNADRVREQFNDWDFSIQGRVRQSRRMRDLADECTTNFVICDFVAPIPVMRYNFYPHWTIWVDTIKEGRFADTNALFVAPDSYDIRVTDYSPEWPARIVNYILKV